MRKVLTSLAMPGGQVPRMQEGLRVYAIGDVHGCLDKLEALELLIADDARSAKGEVRIVMTGDYVDRGPQSRETIEHLTRVKDTRTILGGNHDFFLPINGETGEFLPWYRYGGIQTLLSYGIDVRDMTERDFMSHATNIAKEFASKCPGHHKDFIRGLGLTAQFGDYLFVHAGIDPRKPMIAQTEDDFTFIREPFLSGEDDYGFVVVHGHTPRDDVENLPNRINIDTGAVFGRRLTALALDGAERWVLQV